MPTNQITLNLIHLTTQELYFFAERGMKNAYTSAVVINAFPSEGGGAVYQVLEIILELKTSISS